MGSAARKILSRMLLSTLVLSALASVAGGGALVLERRGLVTLRRVPSPVIKSWVDGRGPAIAIINTDTTAGSFLLGFEIDGPAMSVGPPRRLGFLGDPDRHPTGGEVRVWVPPQSIVLRTHPNLARGGCAVWLYDARGSVGRFVDDYRGRAVLRGTRVFLEWLRYPDWEKGVKPDGFHVPSDGIRVVEQPGIKPVEKDGETLHFDWDGKTAVAVEVDTTTPPPILEVSATCVRSEWGSVGASYFWAYPPDMTVIDERDAREGGK